MLNTRHVSTRKMITPLYDAYVCHLFRNWLNHGFPNYKVHGANMSAPDGPHVDPMSLAIRVGVKHTTSYFLHLWWPIPVTHACNPSVYFRDLTIWQAQVSYEKNTLPFYINGRAFCRVCEWDKVYSLSCPLCNIWGCVFYPFSLWWEYIYVYIYIYCLSIIIKSEVWTITHCIWLGHQTIGCAAWLSILLLLKGLWHRHIALGIKAPESGRVDYGNNCNKL